MAQGKTILVAAAATAPLGILLSVTNPEMDAGTQMRVHNAGPNTAFIASGASAAAAQAAAVIPTGAVSQNVYAIPSGAIEVLTIQKNLFWSGICAATQTASVYLVPGDGI